MELTIVLFILAIGSVLAGAYFVLNNMGLINRKDKPMVEAPYRRPKAVLKTQQYGICRVEAKNMLRYNPEPYFELILDNGQQKIKKAYYDHEIQPIVNHQCIVGNDAPQFQETMLDIGKEEKDKSREIEKLKKENLDKTAKLKYKMEQIDREIDKAVDRAEKIKRAEAKPFKSPIK
jgi:hypothetical protein